MDHKDHFKLSVVAVLVLLLSIVKDVAADGNERSCPHFGLNFRGRCFWFVDVRTTWYEAAHLCHRLYGDRVTLVTIKDRETNDFVRSHWQRGFWIGLHEAFGETIWRWVDNTEPTNENYQNWEGGITPPVRPGSRNCAFMKYDNDLWTDADCGSLRAFFVCAELPVGPMCPRGGIFFRDRCYWRGNSQLPWADANQACQRDFGPETRLAVAKDAETSLFLSRLAGRHIWLGLSDRKEEGVWEWIDGSPIEYNNWAENAPDNFHGKEDCGQLIYPSAKWNDIECGDPEPGSGRVRLAFSYICALPPCYERPENDQLGTVSNEEVQISNRSICAQTKCTQHCVHGGACNPFGQCICSKQFPEMTCDLDAWEVEMENELVHTTTGSTLTLKCKVNLPRDHISSLSWTKCEPSFLPEYRHKIKDHLAHGYSILQISDVMEEDAGQYHCKVAVRFSNSTIHVSRTTSVNVTEGSTPVPTTKQTTERVTTTTEETTTPFATTKVTTGRRSAKDTQTTATTTEWTNAERVIPTDHFTVQTPAKTGERTKKEAINESDQQFNKRPTGTTSALIVILVVVTTFFSVTVFVLMIKIKKLERRGPENSGLVELQ